MTYIALSRMIAAVSGIVLTYGLYAQVWKIFNTKSAQDFTLSIILAILFNEIAWLNYGITTTEWPIILITSLNLPAGILMALVHSNSCHNQLHILQF
jgi:MtN3 and saliva related transmembrane protein